MTHHPQHGEASEDVSAEGLEASRGKRGSCSDPGPPSGTLADVYSWVKAASTPPRVGPTQYTCGKEGQVRSGGRELKRKNIEGRKEYNRDIPRLHHYRQLIKSISLSLTKSCIVM